MSSKSNTPEFRFPGHNGDWIQIKLGNICSSFSGGTPKSGNTSYYGGNIPFIRSGEIHASSTELFLTEDGIKNSSAKLVKKGDLLYALYGATSGDVSLSKIDGAINQAILCIRSKSLDMSFLCFYLEHMKSHITSKYLQGGQGNLSGDIIMSLSIGCPSFAEQQKIAECLSAVDETIIAQQKKVDAIKEHKKGMMQQMFPAFGETTPSLRFPGFEGEWEEKQMNEVFDRITTKNQENNSNVLTISAQYGLISQLEFFNKSVAASDVTGYYLLHNGDFAYNKSSSQGRPVGAIKPLRLYDKGVVSTLYICFRCKDPQQIDFWEQYFEAGMLDREIRSIAQEGARNHGLLNISTSEFFNLIVRMPSQKEQKKIAECLAVIDETIASEEKKLETLKEHKRGLMQKMFPNPTK